MLHGVLKQNKVHDCICLIVFIQRLQGTRLVVSIWLHQLANAQLPLLLKIVQWIAGLVQKLRNNVIFMLLEQAVPPSESCTDP